MTTHTKRDEMLAGLQTFIRKRPGFDPNNYGDGASYRADVRSAGRDLREAEELLRAVRLRQSCEIPENKGQRLFWTGKEWEYTTGQYFPTEYRAAACQLLASALWNWYASGLPEKTHTHNQETGEITERYDGLRAGEWIRRAALRDLGPRLARRWFS